MDNQKLLKMLVGSILKKRLSKLTVAKQNWNIYNGLFAVYDHASVDSYGQALLSFLSTNCIPDSESLVFNDRPVTRFASGFDGLLWALPRIRLTLADIRVEILL